MRKTEYPPALRDLVAQLRQMPGVGPRSAERIALWIVQARGDQPEQIARAISETRRGIHPCKLCGYFTTNELCDICSDSSRAAELLCVVEQPTDILPLEKTGVFRGRYHSLGGRIYVTASALRPNKAVAASLPPSSDYGVASCGAPRRQRATATMPILARVAFREHDPLRRSVESGE